MSMVNTKSAGGIIIATASVASGAAAGTISAMDLKWSPLVGASKEVIIPANELWEIKDAYVISATDAGSGDVIPQVNLKKDNDRIMDTTEILDAVVISNTSRPNGLHANVRYEGASHISADLITNKLSTGAANLRVIFPFEKSG